jgi:hypothetical protein
VVRFHSLAPAFALRCAAGYGSAGQKGWQTGTRHLVPYRKGYGPEGRKSWQTVCGLTNCAKPIHSALVQDGFTEWQKLLINFDFLSCRAFYHKKRLVKNRGARPFRNQ